MFTHTMPDTVVITGLDVFSRIDDGCSVVLSTKKQGADGLVSMMLDYRSGFLNIDEYTPSEMGVNVKSIKSIAASEEGQVIIPSRLDLLIFERDHTTNKLYFSGEVRNKAEGPKHVITDVAIAGQYLAVVQGPFVKLYKTKGDWADPTFRKVIEYQKEEEDTWKEEHPYKQAAFKSVDIAEQDGYILLAVSYQQEPVRARDSVKYEAEVLKIDPKNPKDYELISSIKAHADFIRVDKDKTLRGVRLPLQKEVKRIISSGEQKFNHILLNSDKYVTGDFGKDNMIIAATPKEVMAYNMNFDRS